MGMMHPGNTLDKAIVEDLIYRYTNQKKSILTGGIMVMTAMFICGYAIVFISSLRDMSIHNIVKQASVGVFVMIITLAYFVIKKSSREKVISKLRTGDFLWYIGEITFIESYDESKTYEIDHEINASGKLINREPRFNVGDKVIVLRVHELLRTTLIAHIKTER